MGEEWLVLIQVEEAQNAFLVTVTQEKLKCFIDNKITPEST